jgi:hypothetical protein
MLVNFPHWLWCTAYVAAARNITHCAYSEGSIQAQLTFVNLNLSLPPPILQLFPRQPRHHPSFEIRPFPPLIEQWGNVRNDGDTQVAKEMKKEGVRIMGGRRFCFWLNASPSGIPPLFANPPGMKLQQLAKTSSMYFFG